MIFDIFSIAGWIGGILLILAYFLLATKKIKSHSISYNLLNAFGGLGLIVSTFATKSWPSFALNIAWVGIAIFTISKIKKIKPVYKQLKVK
ncbi:MAG TPA: hypothetical protein VMC80_02805 [Patescibacteria group bacterium]|nr:hypothetical protein [Patescibacteria group bacterium]